MLKESKRKILFHIFGLVLVFGFLWSFNSLLAAWQAPSAEPPNGNVSAPIYSESFSDQGITGGNDLINLGGDYLAWDMTATNYLLGWRIGAGTINPQSGVHVYGNSEESSRITVENINADGNPKLQLTNADKTWQIQVLGYDNDQFSILDLGQERLTINGSGNVGIGTIDPSAGKLVVNGNIVVAENNALRLAENGGNNFIGLKAPISLSSDITFIWPNSAGANGYVLTTNGNPSTPALSWSAKGVSAISQGTGLAFSTNPITDTGTISADTNYLQRRIGGSCALGNSIRVINSDGTVACEPDDSGGTITGVTAGTGLTGGGMTGNITLNVTAGSGIIVGADDISADANYLQRRVSGSCGTGNSIRVINSDGTVACEPDDGGNIPCNWNGTSGPPSCQCTSMLDCAMCSSGGECVSKDVSYIAITCTGGIVSLMQTASAACGYCSCNDAGG